MNERRKAIGFSILWTAILLGCYGIFLLVPYTGLFHFLIEVVFFAIAAAVMLYTHFNHIKMRDLGFRLLEDSMFKKSLYFAPLIAAVILKIVIIALQNFGGKVIFSVILELIVSGIVIVTVEELFFRGYILKTTGKAFSKVKGIFISAAFFTLYSLLFNGFTSYRMTEPLLIVYSVIFDIVDTFIVGVTAAAIVCLCKSVYPVIIWRLVCYVIERYVGSNMFDFISQYITAFYAGYLIYVIYKREKMEKETEHFETEYNDTFSDNDKTSETKEAEEDGEETDTQ